MTAGEYCNREVIIVEPECTITEAAKLMQSRGVRRILVVDEAGTLQGLMSTDNAIELIAEAMDNLTKVVRHEIMNEQRVYI